MKLIDPVNVQVVSRRSFRPRTELFELMAFHESSLPQLKPSVYNWTGSLNKPWDLSKPEGYIPDDGFFDTETIYWRRKKKPKASGYFVVDQRFAVPSSEWLHGGTSFVAELAGLDVDSVIHHIKVASLKFDGDLAQVHWVAPQEESIRDMEYSFNIAGSNGGSEFVIGSLRHWLPALPWAVVFGKAYVRMFGLERLLSAPAYKVEKLSDDAVYLQLSANLTDLQTDYDAVHVVREKVQAHLGREAFFDVSRAYPLRGGAGIGELPMDQWIKALEKFRPPEPGTNGFRVPEFKLIPDGLPLTAPAQIVTQVAEFSEKYDDASWHYGGDDFSEHLPPEAGMTHMAMFWAWAILAGLGKDANLSADVREKMVSNRASPRTCFSQRNAEKFTDADLTEEGKAFTEHYYEDDYIEDYVRIFADATSAYEVEDSWENFSKLTTILDKRLAEWRHQSQQL